MAVARVVKMNEEREVERISEPAYEIAVGSLQMQCKRLFILCIIIFVALIGTNGAWIWHESQYIDEETTLTQDIDTGEGDATVVGIGDYYGEGSSNSNKEDTD